LAQAGIKLTDIKPVYVDISAATVLMREGKIDGFFYVGGSPAPAITQLAEAVDIQLLGVPANLIERVLKTNQYYGSSVIPAGAYNGTEETETLSVYALLAVNEALSPDLAYSILRSLWHKTARAMLNGGHAQGKLIGLETALNGVTIPLHPGAQRYYSETGLLKDDSRPTTPAKSGAPPSNGAGERR
jgi:TRAP transporter TAXI family solute receptor